MYLTDLWQLILAANTVSLPGCPADSRLSSRKKKERSSARGDPNQAMENRDVEAAGGEGKHRSSLGESPSQEVISKPQRIFKKEGHEVQQIAARPRREETEGRTDPAGASRVRLPATNRRSCH